MADSQTIIGRGATEGARLFRDWFGGLEHAAADNATAPARNPFITFFIHSSTAFESLAAAVMPRSVPCCR